MGKAAEEMMSMHVRTGTTGRLTHILAPRRLSFHSGPWQVMCRTTAAIGAESGGYRDRHDMEETAI